MVISKCIVLACAKKVQMAMLTKIFNNQQHVDSTGAQQCCTSGSSKCQHRWPIEIQSECLNQQHCFYVLTEWRANARHLAGDCGYHLASDCGLHAMVSPDVVPADESGSRASAISSCRAGGGIVVVENNSRDPRLDTWLLDWIRGRADWGFGERVIWKKIKDY